MPRSLDERAAEIRARNALLRSIPGSGYHDNDTDLNGKFRAPHRRTGPGGQVLDSPPEAPIDEHLIAFYGERDVVFVGEDAARAAAAVKGYAAAVKKRIEDALATGDGMPQLTGTDWAIMGRIAQRMTVADGVLRVWREDWNDVLHVFDAVPLGTTGAPYADHESP